LSELSGEKFIYPRSAVLVEKTRQLIRKYESVLRFQELATAFNRWLQSYLLVVPPEVKTPDYLRFLNGMHPELMRVLHLVEAEHAQFSFQVSFYCKFYLSRDPEVKIEWYVPNTMDNVLNSTELEPILNAKMLDIGKRIQEFTKRGSGWVYERAISLQVNIGRYRALSGSTYVDLPKYLKDKKAIINVQNTDNQCFKWAVLSALHPAEKDGQRVSKYKPFEDDLKFDGIPFPVLLCDIAKFERKNGLAIFLYHLATNNDVQPLRISEKDVDKAHRIHLFLFKDHYMWIKSMSRLLYDKTQHEHRKHFCDFCCSSFNSEDNRDEHESLCSQVDLAQKVKMPKPESASLSFKGQLKMLKAPFVIYADFEALNMKESLPKPTDKTTYLTRHEPSSFSYIIIRSDGVLFKRRLFRGENAAAKFVEHMKEDVEEVKKALKEIVPMRLSSDDWRTYHSTKACHICKRPFDPTSKTLRKVRDHDHITGEFRGAAHSLCNLNFRFSPKIPIFFHNLRGYDSHIIMQGVEAADEIEVIANNIEKYLAFKLGKNLVFKDSLQFLPESLEKLVKNLSKDDFILTAQRFPSDKLDLMLRKGVCPYAYLDSWARFDETEPPPKAAFFNDLTGEELPDDDYQHFLNVWNKFGIKTLGEYNDLYLELDVFLLADIFENFRKKTLENYKLDPAHYFTSPHLSFDALLTTCKEPIELLTDIDMHLLFEQGMRGGISVASHRYVKANPKYKYVNTRREDNPNFDPTLPSSYILYLDANNLYGWAMTQLLPTGGFHWLAQEELEKLTPEAIMEWSAEGDKGFAVECDLGYPQELHNAHSDYPLAPEGLNVTKEMLSPFQQEVAIEENIKMAACERLAPNLYDKRKYFCHYRNLQFYLQQGMVLGKIHRVIQFDQRPWMKEYIEKNTIRRQHAKTKFEQNLLKLWNNSVFGKTMENVRKRKEVKFPSTEKQLRKLTASPRWCDLRIFKETLAALEMKKTSVVLNKPVFTGFTVLELSKLLMFQFWYECIKPLYGEKVKLLYTDTDSLIIHVETEDVYQDMKEHSDWFDTSDYPTDHPCFSLTNKKVPGKMKDELNGELILEFVGIRSKMYSILTETDKTSKRAAKGVSKHVTEKILRHADYVDCVKSTIKSQHSMSQIRAKKHQIYTTLMQKTTLNPLDTKRWICDDGISTLPFGHYSTKNDIPNPTDSIVPFN
jgi:hypothetical protein